MKNTAHLTAGHEPGLSAQIAKARPGMAHWAATGPFGRTCGDCSYLGYWQQIQDATGNTVTTKQRHGCAKFLALTGRHGPIVLERTKPVATSRPGTTTHRANATRVSARRLFGREQMAEHEPCIGKSDDWFTPQPVFDALDREFDLDPAHPGRDNPHCVVPTRKIFTKADDGLRQPWHGLVWLNPPFGGRRGQVPWLRKFFAHNNGIALVAARTSADWFHEVVVPNAELLCFPNGKTKFVKPNGEIGKEPGTGVALIAVGRVACEALLRSGLGACMTIVAPYNAAAGFDASIRLLRLAP